MSRDVLAALKFAVLIVDPDSMFRSRLKQAVLAAGPFRQVHVCSSMKESLDQLKKLVPCDVVFVSHRLGLEGLEKYIEAAKDTSRGKDAAYVLVESGARRSEAETAANLLRGVDGVLYEPYSVDNVLAAARIAARVKLAKQQERERAVTEVVLTDSLEIVDRIGLGIIEGHQVADELKQLQEVCSPLAEVKALTPAMYLEIASLVFEQAPVPMVAAKFQPYGGMSKRVQNRLDSRGQPPVGKPK